MEHHAHLFLAESLEMSSVPLHYKTQSVDVVHIHRERFSIDDARELTRSSALLAFEGTTRVFVIVARDIAPEAQNALLKLLEEPPLHAQFYIVLKPTAFLLPTLRSRLFVGDIQDVGISGEKNENFNLFLRASYGDRIASIAEKTKEKDTVWIEDIIRGCEWHATHVPTRSVIMLEATMFVRMYIGTKGASSKMLLEELGLVLPQG